VIGEVAVLVAGRRSASVVATTPMRLRELIGTRTMPAAQ
jgi:CRP-like cAMP-binding protein